ncbi:MAG: hypothetical protein RL748_504, partial [Pseudomonadota bacterium]
MTTAASDPVRRTLFLQELGLQPQWQRKALAQVQGEADLPVPSVSTADDPAAAAMNQASP